ncbi:polyprenyl synthetase family protein [Streptomyces sp. NPDC059785]|uniref:polyprenyl synthetase family protein n=1 Tax=Streptomyces sp. NPDC059785 TaxID=3346945 RepID=UPI00364DCB7E
MRHPRAGDHATAGQDPAPGHRAVPDGHPADVPDDAPVFAGAAAEEIDADVPGAVGHVLETVLRDRVERARALDPVFGADIAERVARLTLHGGKRMRPQLLWWALRGCGGGLEPDQRESALRLAAALELLQTCALVQDDVMDASALRRGRPALHVELGAQYPAQGPRTSRSLGRAGAILAGDLALAWADDVFAAQQADAGPKAAPAVREIWREMRTEMVAGQYLDVLDQATSARSAARAIRAACLKSARYSVERPLALGAALAGAGARTTEALGAAGRCAGIAFQLHDDLLGAFGDPRLTGKPSGDDLREGKRTYLVAVARARAEEHRDRASLEVLDHRIGAGRLSQAELAEVRDVLVATGARAAVEKRIERLVRRGTDHLADAALAPGPAHRLRRLLNAAAGLTDTWPAPGGGGEGPSQHPAGNDEPPPTACLSGTAGPGEVR